MSNEVVMNVDSLVASATIAHEANDAVPKINILIESPEANNDNMVLCKICHDEGPKSEMEVPCACHGTMMFAHRKCVQKWIDCKKNIICEICHQEYRPDYSVSPASEANDRLNGENEGNNCGVRFFDFVGTVVTLLLCIHPFLPLAVDGRDVQPTAMYLNISEVFVKYGTFIFPGYVILRMIFLVRQRGWRRVLY